MPSVGSKLVVVAALVAFAGCTNRTTGAVFMAGGAVGVVGGGSILAGTCASGCKPAGAAVGGVSAGVGLTLALLGYMIYSAKEGPPSTDPDPAALAAPPPEPKFSPPPP
ncbi:MAG TPA: hypothetical protein VGM56_27340 [Byssovorax sp.]|jgi:hypothetical protein